MSLGDTAVRGTGLVLGTQGIRAALQFGSVIILARLLVPEDFGLVAMVTAVIGIAEIIRDAGLSSAAVQSTVLTEQERTNLFWANFGLGTACAVAAMAAAPLIVAGYGEPRLGPIVLVLACVFVFSGANTQFKSDLMRRMRFRQLAMADLTAQFLAITVAVALALAGAGLWAIVAQQVTTAVATLTINVINVRWLPGWPVRGVSLARFFRFGGGVLGTHGLSYITKSISNVAIGAALGAAPLGLYNRAYQLLMTPLQQIDAPMTSVFLPVLSRVKDDDTTFTRYVGKIQLMACYVTATVLSVAAGVATPLTLVLFGERWRGVVPIFAILAIGGVFRTTSMLAYWIFLAKGRTGTQLRQDLIARPIMIGIMVAGLPWGVVGVAAGHSIAFFLYWIVTFVTVGQSTGLDVRPLFRAAIRNAVLVSVPCGLTAFAVSTAMHTSALLELAAGVLAAGCWFVVAWLLFPPVRRDLLVAGSLLRRALPQPRRGRHRAPSRIASRRQAATPSQTHVAS
jgi:PST family polysaccharide transporter